MSLMGMDVGTTGTKANIFDEQGQIIASAYRKYPLVHPRPGWIELDPEEVWRNVREAVAGVAVGVYDSAAGAARELVATRETFPPDLRKAAYYDEMLGRYRELYPALKGWQAACERSREQT